MKEQSFYSSGLKFSCIRCSYCCRKESGFVYLSENDLSVLAKKLGMDYTDFVKTWCRWVPFTRNRERLSLKEKSNFDCIFWSASIGGGVSEGDIASFRGAGCAVYDDRPLQCRTYPFWDSVVCSEKAWNETGKGCPGINSGTLHEKETIENFIHRLENEPVIERIIQRPGEAG